MAQINDDTLHHLYELSRIGEDTDEKKRAKLLGDLSKILDHFNELQELNTDTVDPLAGGTQLYNVYQVDDTPLDREVYARERNNSMVQFPEHERGYLKVPPIFE